MHGEGESYGSPFRLRPDQREAIWRWYELDPDGLFVYRRALIETAKGWGKTEIGAAAGHAETFGPASPWARGRGPANTPVAAASLEQANRLFERARQMAGHERALLRHLIEGGSPGLAGFDLVMLAKDSPSRMFRVAAEAGTNDGGLPTLFIADEVHEWDGRRRRVHLVIGNSLVKRIGARELNLTTPGDDADGLAYELHTYGVKVLTGEVEDPHFLFVWLTADRNLDLSSVKERDRAIRQANPHASEPQVVALHRRYHEIPEHEFRRYHLAQWVFGGGSRFMDPEAFAARADRERKLEAGERVVLAFDGSYLHDSTAIVGETLDGHIFVVGEWASDGSEDWQVPREAVDAAVDRAFREHKVLRFACDPPGWHAEIAGWAARYGSSVVVEFPTHVRSRMAAACGQFYSDVMAGAITHDGDPRLIRHIGHAVWRETREGAYITKDSPNSPRKIDLAVVAVVAHDQVVRLRTEPRTEPRIRTLGGTS